MEPGIRCADMAGQMPTSRNYRPEGYSQLPPSSAQAKEAAAKDSEQVL